jgi:hypothetical protein
VSYTLLLTCVGGELSPQTIRALKSSPRHQVKVIGVDAHADAAGRHFADEFAVVPPGTDSHYAEAIGDLVARHKVDMVLPTSDEEALALSAARLLVESDGCVLACAPVEVLRVIANKAAAYDRLSEIGVPVPDWRLASTPEELAAAVAEIVEAHGAAVIKPARGRGGRGVCVIRHDGESNDPRRSGREIHMDVAAFQREHRHRFTEHLPAVVMEHLIEPVHDIDMLAWHGASVRVVARRRVDSALPNEGHTIVGGADLITLGQQLIEGLGLTWLYDCDVMYNRKGFPGILEINPRPSGSIATTIAAGVPMLDDLISLAKGEAVTEIEAPIGRVVVPFKSLAIARG